MLAQLPDEVLLTILDELAPDPSYRQDDDSARRRALCRACLASRRMRRLAQPFLWRRVEVADDEDLEHVRARPGIDVFGRFTKAFEVRRLKDVSLNDTADVADTFPNLDSMELFDEGV